MNLGFATVFDAQDVNNWSGTPFYMSCALSKEVMSLLLLHKLRRLPPLFKLKKFWQKTFFGIRESPRFNSYVAKYYSAQVEKYIAAQSLDAILAPQVNPIAYINAKIPLILWTDASYASLIDFYPDFMKHSATVRKAAHTITQECLNRCQLVIYSSEWAARTTMAAYKVSQEKIAIVPFGANFHTNYSLADIRQIIRARRLQKHIHLLFIGKDWQRKGADIALIIADTLHKAGRKVLLHLVGCTPPNDIFIPPYVICHGLIAKNSPAGIAKLQKLFCESHFLLVPSRAEAYGIVFCEANAFGLPAISSDVGGIPTIIRNGINGQSFSLKTEAIKYCEFIQTLMDNFSQYEALALSAYNEFLSRLNWQVAAKRVKQLVQDIL